MAVSVYDFSNYKEFIRRQIDAHRSIRGYRSQIAQAASCQRTYLSQALHGSVELTPEHVVGLASFWGMDDDETEYFLSLLGLSRAGTQLLRKVMSEKLEKLRQRRESLTARLNEPRLTDAHQEMLYCSSWVWTALHALTSLRTPPSSVQAASVLNLPEALVESHLNVLQEMGLVRFESGHWKVIQKTLHIPKDSPGTWMHHQNWRHQALQDAKKPSQKSFHYTSLHILSKRDAQKLLKMMKEFILEIHKTVKPSPEESIVCVCCDLFPVAIGAAESA